MIHGHGGNIQALAKKLGCSAEEIIDMSSNLNPLGPPKEVEPLIKRSINKICSLPEADASSMVQAFADYMDMDKNRIIAANGTTWFIYTIPLALGSKNAIICGPTYSDYKDACIMHNIQFQHCNARSESNFAPSIEAISDMANNADLLFLCNPNNPTGALLQKNELVRLIQRHKKTCFVIDESYMPFVENASDLSLIRHTDLSNLIVLSSMSKIFTIPGLRTGFLTSSPHIVDQIMTYYQPWSVNSIAQSTVTALLNQKDKLESFYETTRKYMKKEKQAFVSALDNVDHVNLFDSSTYFILAGLSGNIDAEFMCDFIGQHKILIRNCSNFHGLNKAYVRFSLKTTRINNLLSDMIKKAVYHAG